MDTCLVHATAVAFQYSCVLLRGASGAGKSDLALRLIGLGGLLVSDDQVILKKMGDTVVASAPETIKSLLEVRGVGLLRVPSMAEARLALIVDLVAPQDVPRLPEYQDEDILGIKVQTLRLYGFEASSALKVKYALEAALDPGLIHL